MSINDIIEFLENMKLEFKGTVSRKKYRSGLNKQLTNKGLNYMIDPTFRDINRLFVISFKSGGNVPERNYFVDISRYQIF